MPHPQSAQHICLSESSTCHPNDPIPKEPIMSSRYRRNSTKSEQSPSSSSQSLVYTSGSDNETPGTPATDSQLDGAVDENPVEVKDRSNDEATFVVPPSTPRKRRASTVLISQSPEDVKRILSPARGAETKEIEKICCGGGWCFLDALKEDPTTKASLPVVIPPNEAFRSLQLRLGPLSLDSQLHKIVDLPPQTVFFKPLASRAPSVTSTVHQHPPTFVTPHAPYEVFSAKVHHARELTKAGAEKRTYHFDLDVTEYPAESGDVDFVVGGAIGVQAPNSEELVDEIFNLLNIPKYACLSGAQMYRATLPRSLFSVYLLSMLPHRTKRKYFSTSPPRKVKPPFAISAQDHISPSLNY